MANKSEIIVDLAEGITHGVIDVDTIFRNQQPDLDTISLEIVGGTIGADEYPVMVSAENDGNFKQIMDGTEEVKISAANPIIPLIRHTGCYKVDVSSATSTDVKIKAWI